MKINPISFGIASATAAAVFWLLCSAVVAMIPGPMMNMSGHMVHANLEGAMWTLTFSGVITGLVVWSLFSGLFGWVLALIYNLLEAKNSTSGIS
ncbi:MAG: DUF5676 family membrane protein [Acidobacteriota bacterium]|nr:DUF5676 family membrane protein [Acidobacteriota bacterium]MDH3527978.1 DUF5676 family membrane protein [Acidobacteriota bacterium]